MLLESFSFFQEFNISFELRFKALSQKKIPKNPKIAGITWSATKIDYFA